MLLTCAPAAIPSSLVLSVALIRPLSLCEALRTVFFVGVMTPLVFWVMLPMKATAVPLAVGSATAVWVGLAPMLAGVIPRLARALAALVAPVPPEATSSGMFRYNLEMRVVPLKMLFALVIKVPSR